ncbi:MAG: PEP-CTERM sorting domain-containing protein [Akkermansia sp.]|nr:PEP-CTERM sorting domain-containing protein [Akkermansia sp.]
MKKTLIALMALAGVAAAEQYSITPLTDSTFGTWTHSNNNTITNGVLSGNPNWQVDPSTYSVGGVYTYSEDEPLTFSFDVQNNGTGNGMLTLTFIGTENAIVIGHGNYDKYPDGNGGEITNRGGDVQVGLTTNLTAQGYGFANTNPGDDAQLTALTNWENAMPFNGAITTLSGIIAWDGDSYSLTLNSSAKTETLTCDLGLTKLDLTKIMVTIEGGSTYYDDRDAWKTATLSNLTVSVPEPATATLSLLALAGLAVRRRRK